MFVAGGISVVVRTRHLVANQTRVGRFCIGLASPPYLAFNLVLLASFGGLVWLAARNQANAELGWMQNYWKDNLPSLAAPLRFAWWLLVTHTGDLLAIPDRRRARRQHADFRALSCRACGAWSARGA